MRGQTTMGGCLCVDGVHRPDYYAYEAGAGSRNRKQEYKQQEAGHDAAAGTRLLSKFDGL